MTPLRDERYFRYLRRRAQTPRTKTLDHRPQCLVLPFVREYPYRVGAGGIFQLLDDSGNSHAHRS